MRTRSLIIGFGILAMTMTMAGNGQPQNKTSGKARPAGIKNRPPIIQSFTSSSTTRDFCPWASLSSDCSGDDKFQLEVKASDPDNDNLSYTYSPTNGVIIGNGPGVVWKFTQVGSHKITVKVSDGKGGSAIASIDVEVRVCPICDGPPCPTVTVSCPDVAFEEPVKFMANFSSSDKVTFVWTVSNGRIAKGKGSATIEVIVVDAEKPITATVEIGGRPPSCNRVSSCTTTMSKKE